MIELLGIIAGVIVGSALSARRDMVREEIEYQMLRRAAVRAETERALRRARELGREAREDIEAIGP
ncbi:hypothetical protein [Streptomyces sp. S.PB5]|uniref:hypothetical protein n=1 Tax=Streptomyces sp. S.PB5 TaxID=3020844 RepID=UPI0025B1C4C1|nr:hypothetical protein [Streptomyces sp. S.PB5]MDN3027159.1 hypothetical protein [Streptomyces sp. S.PB5]